MGKKMGRLIDVDEIPIDCDYYDVENAPTVEAIPKAEYEARLKADMVAILGKIRAEILEDCGYSKDYVGAFTYSTIKVANVLQILDKYK